MSAGNVKYVCNSRNDECGFTVNSVFCTPRGSATFHVTSHECSWMGCSVPPWSELTAYSRRT